MEERNQKKLEKKRKRSEAAAKRESRIVDAKRRWYDNVPAFNPNRGLRDKTLENAQWKNLVAGLNKAFPKSQGNADTRYGPMNRTDIAEIQKYEATLPQEELDKWRHQNQMIDQVVAMKYDKKSRKWWARIPSEKNPNSFQINKGYPKWWMDENFHPDYIEMTKFQDQFLPVPVGDVNEDKAPPDLLTNIKVAFQQKQRSTCLFSSTASALAYCKRKQEATNLIRRSNKVENLDLLTQN